MAIKVRDITIEDEASRDHGKTYRLTEMPAIPLDKWVARALLALGKSGVDIPDEVRQQGAAAIMTIGIRAFVGVQFADAEPLMDEMLDCITFVPAKQGDARKLFPGDIEEVETLWHLRGQLMELHTGFTVRAAASKLAAVATEWMLSLLTQTSPDPSEPLSAPDSPPGPNLEQPLV